MMVDIEQTGKIQSEGFTGDQGTQKYQGGMLESPHNCRGSSHFARMFKLRQAKGSKMIGENILHSHIHICQYSELKCKIMYQTYALSRQSMIIYHHPLFCAHTAWILSLMLTVFVWLHIVSSIQILFHSDLNFPYASTKIGRLSVNSY